MIHWKVRRETTLRPIVPTKAQENELYSIYWASIRIWQKLAADVAANWSQPAQITIDAPDGTQLQWLIDQADAWSRDTLIYQTERLGRWVTKVGKWNGAKTIAGIKSATGTDVEPFIRLSDVREELELAIRQNVALISSVNADTKNRVQQIIFDGFAQRKTKKQITDELAKAMGITKRRARIIAGDQLHKLNIAMSKHRNLQLGITRYKWGRTISRHERPHHLARVGKVFRWDKPPWDGPPGYAIGCKCSAAAILDYDGE